MMQRIDYHPALSKETMFQSGIGFRNTDQRNYLQPKEELRNLLLMKL